MTLQNFWWLLGWLFIVGGLSLVFSPQQEEIVLGQRCVRWNWLYAAILALPFVIWAGWRTNSFGDTGAYRITFNSMPTGLDQMAGYVASRPKGKGFVVFEYLFKSFVTSSDTAFFFVVALFQIFCLVYIYRKYSRNFWLSFFLFIASTDYMSWVFNSVRQFIAVCLIFVFYPLLVKRKYAAMTAVILLAATIHISALVVLPIMFIVNGRVWNFRAIGFLIAVIVSFFFVNEITGFLVDIMENTAYEGDIVYLLNDDGTNALRVLFYSVPAIMSFVFRPYIEAADDPMINICANLSIAAAGFYIFSLFTSGILMGSIPIYFSLANYILIPWLLTEVFEPSSAVLMETAFVGVYSFFFYYQMGATWHLL